MRVENMIPMAVSDIIVDRPNLVDVYVNLSGDKYVLIYKKGDVPDKARVESYKQKAEHFWVRKDEYYKLTLRNLTLAGMALKRDGLAPKQKTLIVLKAAESVYKEMSYMGFNEHNFMRAVDLTNLTLQLASTPKDFKELILLLKNFDDDVFKRSVAVAVVSALIGEHLSWTDESNLQTLVLGSLMRDVGFLKLSTWIAGKSEAEMTFSERQLYYSHPIKSKKLLSQIPGVSEDLLDIVEQHHELPDGTGFPKKLRKINIHPMAEVVILSGLFVDLVINGENSKTVEQALQHIQKNVKAPFNLKTMRALLNSVDKELIKKSG